MCTFIGCGDHGDALEQIVPAHSKPKSRIDIACSVSWKTLLVGQVRRHFAKGDHDQPADKPNERVSQEYPKGPASG